MRAEKAGYHRLSSAQRNDSSSKFNVQGSK
jgi:hypothetical protein